MVFVRTRIKEDARFGLLVTPYPNALQQDVMISFSLLALAIEPSKQNK